MRTRTITFTLLACGVAWGQPPGGRGGMMRPNPLQMALDANRDGAISAEELASAPKALKTLDKNGDGVVAAEEVRPGRPGGGEPSTEMVNTLFSFDANKDGKLSKDEVPERMQGIFGRADADKDGLLTREEIAKASGAQEQRRGGGEGGPPPDPMFRALDANRDGALSEAEMMGAVAALKTLDKDGDGQLSREEIRPMMRGGRGGNPAEMVNHLLEENDANKDGKLSKAEAPERMLEMFDRADANKDGLLTKDELSAMMGRGRQ